MAETDVTLLLGEQMALVFLGVNVLLPLTLSALLAGLILLLVQANRFVKSIMGRANSKEIHNNMADIREAMKTPLKTIETDHAQSQDHSAVRKRRSSIVQQTETSYRPSSSDTSKDNMSSRSNSPPSSLPTSGQSDEGVPKTRKHRIGSGNRVSPMTPSAEVKDKHTSWAWAKPSVQGERNQSCNRQQDGVISPSQCDIQTIFPEVSAKKSLFTDDMTAYDIW